MGYRHQMISEIVTFKEYHIPSWFQEKYGSRIDFSGHYWCSYDEYKLYSSPMWDFLKDVQKILIELRDRDVSSAIEHGFQLVVFADEGQLCHDRADVEHFTVYADRIERRKPTWEVLVVEDFLTIP